MIENIFSPTENTPAVVKVNTSAVSTLLTRPNDAVPYSVSDVISTSTSSPSVLTFANVASFAGGSGNIVKACVYANSNSAMLGASIRLHIYHTQPNAINDNSPFTILWSQINKRVGYIDFPSLATEGTGSDCSQSLWIDVPVAFQCSANDTSLYAIPELTAVGAATSNNLSFQFTLSSEIY